MLFVKKRIEDLQAEAEGQHGLKRTLGPWALTALGIGAIIGAGLFSITGTAAANNAGPAVTISFVIAAVACAFAGLCYAEFASMIPVAGSAYTYSYATLGEFMAWIIGWDLVLEYALGAATVGISWSRYLVKFLHQAFDIHLPPELLSSPWASDSPGIINLPAIVIVVAMSLLLVRGTKESAAVNAVIVGLKIAVVLAFIGIGYSYINPANHAEFPPVNTGEFGEYGWSGVIRAAGIIFFAYIGFDAVSTAAQEAKNPKRDMPIGILASLAICTLLYIMFAHVMTGLANYKEFKGQDGIAPVAVAISHLPAQWQWLSNGILVAILAGYASVIMVMLMGQSRVFFSMSRDGLLPKLFSEVHPRFGTPWKSNLLFCVFVSLFAGFVPGNVVGEMTSIGTLFAFILVCIGVIVLRYTQPNLPRAFKTPLVPLIPILGVICCLVMMIALPGDTWIRLGVWLLAGLVIYFGYSARHSVLRNKKV